MSSENGAFGAYLVGTYEAGRLGVGTILQIINPTTRYLEVIVAFFDDDENLEACKKFHGNDQLSPNEIKEIIIPIQVQGLKPKNGFGVMKIISHQEGQEAVLGIVGFQRQVLPNPDWKGLQCFSETNLAAVPLEIAQEELKKIISKCGYP